MARDPLSLSRDQFTISVVVFFSGKDVTDEYAVHSPSGFISMTAVGKETLFAKASLVFYGNRRSSYGQRFGFKFRVGTTEGVAVRIT